MNKAYILLFVLAVFLASPHAAHSTIQKKNVVCTIEAFAGIVSHIGGAFVNVSHILPEGASPHEYSLTPSDLNLIRSADLVVLVNSKFLSLEANIKESFPNKTFVDFEDYEEYGLTLLPSPGIEENLHGYWLYPDNAIAIAKAIHKYLVVLFPEYKEIFDRNLEDFISGVETLKERMISVGEEKNLAGKGVLIAVPAVAYVAYSFGMIPKASILKAPGSFVSGSEISKIEEKIRSGEISVAMCPESFKDAKPGQILSEINKDTGIPIIYVRVFALAGLDDYIALLTYNIGAVCSVQPNSKSGSTSGEMITYLTLGFAIITIIAIVELFIIFNFKRRAEEVLYE